MLIVNPNTVSTDNECVMVYICQPVANIFGKPVSSGNPLPLSLGPGGELKKRK